jgi:two-component system OmpR family sensor kinase
MLSRIETSVDEQEANQTLTRQFFADASHELRTPLASIRANAELNEQGALTSQAEVDETMRRIRLEATRMGKLVDDMLRLARLGQQPQQRREPFDLSALVTECFERARVSDPRRRWRSNVAPGLVTVGDEDLIRRAIDNLVANVYTHTGVGTTATILAARRNSSVVIKVSDEGPGVPPDQLPHIFERFYRGGAQSERGSGLGLAIVERTAAMHGGSVEASSNSPHGLQITLTLPAWQN